MVFGTNSEIDGQIVKVVKLLPPGAKVLIRVNGVVLQSTINDSHIPTWQLGEYLVYTQRKFEIDVIPDRFLRPIRNPGDDEADESKAWLPPIPSVTKEEVCIS